MSEKTVFILLLIVATSVCDTISQLFLKSSINSLNITIDRIQKVLQFIARLVLVPWVWVGFLFSTASLFIWLFVLSRADLNFAFSADSMHYIFIALASRLILKEKITAIRWVGTLCIVLGILLVALN